MIEIQYPHVLQQIRNFLEQRSRIMDMIGPGVKLSENNSGDE
jgi:hypothetical protein